MASPVDRVLLTARTVRHLRPMQVVHRVRLRSQRAVLGRLPESAGSRLGRRFPEAGSWPPEFVALDSRLAEGFPSPERNAKGIFAFLNEERDLGQPLDWAQPGASRLWRYHLHYFDWAWSFAAHPDRLWAQDAFAELWRSWRQSARFARSDPWSPYAASLRAWALCGVHGPLVAGTELEQELVADLSVHGRFLRAHLELDVGGNHLIKNLKALLGLGVFFGDQRLVAVAVRHLRHQLHVQVLGDGGHYERSPSYHCQVLGDLVDVADLLHAASHPKVPGLDAAIAGMRRWLGAVLMPDGDIPLFNDCVLVGADRLRLLEPGPSPTGRLTVLEPSGYLIARPDERTHFIADVGLPCPPELPAHAHADCLSFELAVDGRRVIVDSGTSTYEPGDRRAYERSTRAHNTVEIDGQDQTEVWGVFRAARRAQPRLERVEEGDGTLEVVASQDGYERLPGRPRHRRRWRLRSGQIEIRDEVSGDGRHRVVARLHTAPGVTVKTLAANRFEIGPTHVELEADEVQLDVDAAIAEGFGALREGGCLSATTDGNLPRALATSIVVLPANPGAA